MMMMIHVYVQGCSEAAVDISDGLLLPLGDSHHGSAWNFSLHCRPNLHLTPPNNVCEAVPRSLFWVPSGLDKLPEACFQIAVQLDWKINNSFFRRLIRSRCILKSSYTERGAQKKDLVLADRWT